MKSQVLLDLIINAEVLEIESDKRTFSHKTDEVALIEPEDDAKTTRGLIKAAQLQEVKTEKEGL